MTLHICDKNLNLMSCLKCQFTGPEVIKLFMLNSTEHEISTAHKNKITTKKFLALKFSDVFITLINVKMPTIAR